MTEIKRNGRPPHYNDAQVIEGIDLVEKDGDHATGEKVKVALVEKLGLPRGINAQSLDKEVARLLEERDRARMEVLVAALPSTSKNAVGGFADRVATSIIELLATDYEKLRSAAGKKLTEMNADLKSHRVQIRQLEDRLERKDASLADSEAHTQQLEQQLQAALAQIAELNNRVATQQNEEDFRGKMLAVMREAMAERDQTNNAQKSG